MPYLFSLHWPEKFPRRGIELLIATLVVLLPGGVILMFALWLCRRAIRAWRKPLPLKADIAAQP